MGPSSTRMGARAPLARCEGWDRRSARLGELRPSCHEFWRPGNRAIPRMPSSREPRPTRDTMQRPRPTRPPPRAPGREAAEGEGKANMGSPIHSLEGSVDMSRHTPTSASAAPCGSAAGPRRRSVNTSHSARDSLVALRRWPRGGGSQGVVEDQFGDGGGAPVARCDGCFRGPPPALALVGACSSKVSSGPRRWPGVGRRSLFRPSSVRGGYPVASCDRVPEGSPPACFSMAVRCAPATNPRAGTPRETGFRCLREAALRGSPMNSTDLVELGAETPYGRVSVMQLPPLRSQVTSVTASGVPAGLTKVVRHL